MPRLLGDGTILPLGRYANGMIALTNVLALLLLWSRGGADRLLLAPIVQS